MCVQPPVDVVVSGPEVEVFDVELVKDNVGLGITIAGYISDKPNGMQLHPSLHCSMSFYTIQYGMDLFGWYHISHSEADHDVCTTLVHLLFAFYVLC